MRRTTCLRSRRLNCRTLQDQMPFRQGFLPHEANTRPGWRADAVFTYRSEENHAWDRAATIRERACRASRRGGARHGQRARGRTRRDGDHHRQRTRSSWWRVPKASRPSPAARAMSPGRVHHGVADAHDGEDRCARRLAQGNRLGAQITQQPSSVMSGRGSGSCCGTVVGCLSIELGGTHNPRSRRSRCSRKIVRTCTNATCSQFSARGPPNRWPRALLPCRR